jgi:hypothetical protein
MPRPQHLGAGVEAWGIVEKTICKLVYQFTGSLLCNDEGTLYFKTSCYRWSADGAISRNLLLRGSSVPIVDLAQITLIHVAFIALYQHYSYGLVFVLWKVILDLCKNPFGLCVHFLIIIGEAYVEL